MKFRHFLSLKLWHKITGAIIIFLIIILAFLPLIVKNYVVRNSEDLIGRKIELSSLKVNYFRWSVTLKEFRMFEKNGKDTFVSFDELYVNFQPWHLLWSEYAFSAVRLVNPEIFITYTAQGFNFDDFLESADSAEIEEPEEESEDVVRYLVRNLNISGGNIVYADSTSDNVTKLKQLNVKVPEISWNNSKSELGVDFIIGDHGSVSLGGSVNQAEGNYLVNVVTKNIDLSAFKGYMKPYLDIADLKGFLYTDVVLKGEMENPLNIKVFGDTEIKNFKMTDPSNQHFLSFDHVTMKLDSLDLGQESYEISSIKVDNLKMTAILDKETTNFDRILAPYYADSLLTEEDTLNLDSTEMHYMIHQVIISNGTIHFTDNTLNRPFFYDISRMNVTLENLCDTTKAQFRFDMILNQTGRFDGNMLFDMKTMENFNFEGNFSNLNMVAFSPYFEYFLARPVTRGLFNYKIFLSMSPTVLRNNNDIRIVNFEVGKKTKDTTAYKVPVGMALYILKDRNNIISIKLPVSGNPSRPEFSLRKIIWKTLEEFLIKTATMPFKAFGNLLGDDHPEKFRQLQFGFLQDSLTSVQYQFLDKIAGVMQAKPDLVFSFTQTTDPKTELAMLAVLEAKMMFLRSLPHADSLKLKEIAAQMNDDQSDFLEFLGVQEPDDEMIAELSLQKAGKQYMEVKFAQLLKNREMAVKSYLKSKGIPESAVIFETADFRNLPEELRKPMFVIDVSMP